MNKHAHLVGISLYVMIVLSLTLAAVPLAGQEKKPAKALKHMEVDLGGGVKMKLVYLEPGKFMMGTPGPKEDNQEWQHEVEITKGFWMGVYTVTQEEYEKIMDGNPSNLHPQPSYFRAGGGGKKMVADMDTRRFPVEQVTWQEAVTFCGRLNSLLKEGKTFKGGMTFRLPTEAEWEYACRAGTTTPFHFGEKLSTDQANFNDTDPAVPGRKPVNRQRTMKVGSFPANAFGLHDMHGNVGQWCADWYSSKYYYKSPKIDPLNGELGLGHVYRGGSWSYYFYDCRSATRYGVIDPAVDRYMSSPNIGFRVVLASPRP